MVSDWSNEEHDFPLDIEVQPIDASETNVKLKVASMVPPKKDKRLDKIEQRVTQNDTDSDKKSNENNDEDSQEKSEEDTAEAEEEEVAEEEEGSQQSKGKGIAEDSDTASDT
ncbi:uncharacterized protein LOC131162666 [Malania oleifera]|uniref:uncharacterized protein LOC131162666 n=1 Tax=Malania oleifera TaxID=397392 RepID=UPI0025AE4FCB|nr:uncharacterized protein LOC131162666 [Malania oleifera]